LEPMQFARLDEVHYALYRNAWRGGERYVQGALVERAALVDAITGRARANRVLAAMSDLVVAWEGEVEALGSASGRGAVASAGGLDGELLYRRRLSAPLSGFELVYSVADLPLGAGARFLAWVTLALAIVLAGGCLLMYRLGAGQIRLNRQQQDFVAAVSHELKTPLTSIRMYAEMLRAGWADEQRRLSYYDFIHDESERLSRLINNVLRLARMTRGQDELALTPVAIGAALERVAARLGSQLEAADFSLERRLEPAAAARVVEIDEDALTQILINLVDNAIKFTPEGAPRRLELRLSAGADTVTVGLRDHGQGVPRAQMKRIFELFYRAESELTRETVGTGIGLALVRRLAGAMRARVDVANREPGAEFTLTLPAAPAAVELVDAGR
ncbi:MAG: sensor histidine kinase, partial [Gammaproteobacteria bacterium]